VRYSPRCFGQARKAGKLRRAKLGAVARVQQFSSDGGTLICAWCSWAVDARDTDTGHELLAKQVSKRERTMKALVLATALLMACGSAYADSCKMEAGNKKLAGAAMTSFMKKCETDAKAACAKSAADKKLAGAAKDSFTKKCVADGIGT